MLLIFVKSNRRNPCHDATGLRGTAIYRLLIQMDWTMKQLSEQCGIPLAELESLMKQETADWTLEQLCTICRAFSISLPEFFDAPMFQRLFLPETP